MKALIEWILSVFNWNGVDLNKPATISIYGVQLIKHFEGCRLTAYRDPANVLTIGYGHTGPDVYPGMTITQGEADRLLQARLDKEFVPGVMRAVQGASQHQLDAMVSLAYNIGVGAFSASTLARKFNAGDIQGAADQFPAWHYAGGKSLKGLRRRRAAERALFLGASVAEAIRVGESHA